jgi:ubiquinone/menaquinone biosynthesis C-methylase UbiE
MIDWFCDTFLFHGKLRELRQRTIQLANLQSGEQVLDVGCGTGTLALEAQQRVSAAGRVFGIDPGARQIARAQFKAARRKSLADFQVGVIQHLTFPDSSLDAVLSTIMFHHLPDSTKRQGLSEIMRVLKPEGRFVIADFNKPAEHQSPSARFGSVRDLESFVKEAGFSVVETDMMAFPQFAGGVVFVVARKS